MQAYSENKSHPTIIRGWRLANATILLIAFFAPWFRDSTALDFLLSFGVVITFFYALLPSGLRQIATFPAFIVDFCLKISICVYAIMNLAVFLKPQFDASRRVRIIFIVLSALGIGSHLWAWRDEQKAWGFYLATLVGLISSAILELSQRKTSSRVSKTDLEYVICSKCGLEQWRGYGVCQKCGLGLEVIA